VVYSPQVLDRLQAVEPAPWEGVAARHMLAGHLPDTENTRGARWNPAGTAAIYLSTTRDGARAEADYHLSLQVPRPRVRRTMYDIELTLANVLDLTQDNILDELGIGLAELTDVTMVACQEVGGAASWLSHDGILVPSARSSAVNLVVYPANRDASAVFEIRGEQELDP
jgi:RES domain-containing protein